MKIFGAVPFNYKGEIKHIINELKREIKYKFKCEIVDDMIIYSGFTDN